MKSCRTAILITLSLTFLACGSSSSGESVGAVCGNIAGKECAGSLYCDYPQGSCGEGDVAGTCKQAPEICIDLYQPVCGCDGKTYSNSCDAAAAGQSVRSDGEC